MRSQSVIKLVNLPWATTKRDLNKHLSQLLNTRIKSTNILYNTQTGLSRGIGFVRIENDSARRELISKQTIDIDGRRVVIRERKDDQETND